MLISALRLLMTVSVVDTHRVHNVMIGQSHYQQVSLMGKAFSKRLCYLQICGPIPCLHQKETSPDAVVATDTLTYTRGSTVSCVWYRSGSFFHCPWAKDSWRRSVRRSVRSLDIFHSVVGIVVRHLSCTLETESFRRRFSFLFSCPYFSFPSPEIFFFFFLFPYPLCAPKH